MASKKEKLRVSLESLLAERTPAVITEQIAASLRVELEPVSDAMFRDLLRGCGYPLAPLLEGVRQDDLHSLERTLLALAQEYRIPEQQRRCRQIVAQAKDHARLVAHNVSVDEAKRKLKEEMVLWMLTWLENPGIFEIWVGMRKHQLSAGRG